MKDENIKYNSERDLSEVEQFGYVLLSDALISGMIPNDLQIQNQSFNEMPIDEMIGRPSDVFDAMEYGSALKQSAEVKSAVAAKSAEVTHQGETA